MATLDQEFERQVENLIGKGYPELAGLAAAAFRDRLEPLRAKAREAATTSTAGESGHVPFVIVVASAAVPAEQAMAKVERQGKNGITVLEADELKRFVPIEGEDVPADMAYLLVDVDTGTEWKNVTPNDALAGIRQQGRLPLTIDEGVALVTHYPERVAKNNGFSLLASRCGDRRVTAIWISENKPKLGWCWAGNPHTWLGSASAARREGL